MKNCDFISKRPEEKPNCYVIPEVFYPAAEREKLLEMIRPVLGESRRLVVENPGEYPILEWFLHSFQLCYQETGSPGL
ncbi:MAG: hypothetical protein P8168_03630 [Deltaproteobacteria bacterium]